MAQKNMELTIENLTAHREGIYNNVLALIGSFVAVDGASMSLVYMNQCEED
jgi:hypothetical protein